MVKKSFLYILFNFIAIHVYSVIAQSTFLRPSNSYIVSHQFISLEQGIASKNVYCGIVDDEGFIWLGTDFGLNRYDGNKFQLITKKEGLKFNKIIGLSKDNKGHLFISYGGSFANTVEAIEILDLKTLQLVSFESVFPKLPFLAKEIVGIYSDQTSDLYFMVQHPLKLWKYGNNTFKLYCDLKLWWNYEKIDNNIFARKRGELYSFYNGNVLLTYNKFFPAYYISPKKTVIFDSTCFLFNVDNKGTISYFDRRSKPTAYNKLYANGMKKLMNLSQDPADKLYCKGATNIFKSCINNFYYFFNNQSQSLQFTDGYGTYTLLDSSIWKSYGNPNINNTFEDKFGNIWVCSSAGLWKISIKKNKFNHYCTSEQLKLKESSSVRGICKDSLGNLFVNIGLSLYKNNQKLATSKLPSGDQEILYGLQFNEQHKIVISIRKGLLYFDEKLDKNFKLKDNKLDISGEEIWCSKKISQSNWLCGSNAHIYSFNEITNQFSYVKYISNDIPQCHFVYKILQTKNKQWWALAESGIYQLNSTCDTIIAYWGSLAARNRASQFSHYLPIINLLDLYEDQNSIFWIATNGEGLYKWDRLWNKLKQFTIVDGFSSNVLYRIEADAYNKLWISSNYGLNCFDINTNLIETFTTKKGITNNEFNRVSSYKSNDGFLYFGGIDGVNELNPKDFNDDSAFTNAPLAIVAFNQFIGSENKLINNTLKIKTEQKIILNPDDKFFTLEFKLLDFESGQHRYAYKIEGTDDKEWNYINENSIRISGLPYGNLTLRVKGQNLEGNWSVNELVIPIIVLKPFYLKLWFISLMITLAIALIYAFIKYRTKWLDRENMRLEQIVTKRTADLELTLLQKDIINKEMHHRVKNNLQVIVSMLRLQARSVDNKTITDALMVAENRLQTISIVHEKLYKSENLSGIILKEYLTELMELLVKQFENISYNIKYNIIDNTYLITNLDTAIPLGLIVNELVTNAFTHAFPTQQDIEVNLLIDEGSNNDYQLTLSDNGIGIGGGILAESNNSFGLRLVKLFAEQLRGSVQYKSDGGSQFIIKFFPVPTS